MNRARAFGARVCAVAVDAVIAGDLVVLVDAQARCEITGVMRTGIAVIAAGIVRLGTLQRGAAGKLLAATGPARTRVAFVHGTLTLGTTVRAVAEDSVIARCGVLDVCADAFGSADVVSARIVIVAIAANIAADTAGDRQVYAIAANAQVFGARVAVIT